jgi:anaerobic selenocysteine-containing dehydrogenase
MSEDAVESHFRTCNLCEAMCGLKIEVKGEKVVSVKGDKEDPFSLGHICPKAVALQDLYDDPDRLTQPVKRTEQGWQTISWQQAFSEITTNLKSIQKQHGDDAVGVYVGNPTVHNLEAMLYGSDFFRQLRTKNRYSATSVDQLPHHLAAMLMFGHPLLLPIPDIDRTDHMLIMGANPVVSNGSIMTVPNVKKRLKAISKRGGKIVTIDPRFTETSQLADQHLFIKPGSDAFALMAMVNFLFQQNLIKDSHLDEHLAGLEAIKPLVAAYTFDNTEAITGIAASVLQQVVEDFCNADKAVLYARIGVSTHEFGSLVNWLVNLFNLLTGNMDSAGGMMFTTPAIDLIGNKKPRSKQFARYFSRVHQYPETIGEFPVATLADEILTPGQGQIKAMVTSAGNPLLSTPNNGKLAQAFEGLEFMFSIDFYINETTKFANIILPPPTPLERPHYDLIFNHLSVRNYAKYSEALFEPKPGSLTEAQIFQKLTQMNRRKSSLKKSMTAKLTAFIKRWLGAEGLVDKGLKKGPYGSGSKNEINNLDLKSLKQHKHGLDLGALKSQFPERLKTKSGQIELAPKEYIEDSARLLKQFELNQQQITSNEQPQQEDTPSMLLIGRRDPRTCNSWMHNCHRLVKGKVACIAFMNIEDGKIRSIEDGDSIKIKSRVGEIELPVSLTDQIMPGVISVPHGWGHGQADTQMATANKYKGVSVNLLTDENHVDQLTGNTALNGVPVTVESIKLDNNKNPQARKF